jgi:hypothetical protein
MRLHRSANNRIVPALAAAAWLLLATGGVSAAIQPPAAGGGDRALPPGVLIADVKGIAVPRTGAYAIDAQNLRPGEVVTKTLTIRNDDADTPFHLGLTAQPGKSTGRYDLLDKVRLELAMDGEVL